MISLKDVRNLVNSVLGNDPVAEDKSKIAWIPRSKYFTEASHKVRVHTSDGNSEVKYVTDEELAVLHKEPHVTKIVAVE